MCKEKLDGLTSPLKLRNKHFDDIVSIEKGRLNDISNIKLLYQDCNLKKE
ncbi:HNH endonuclease [Tissierella sp. MSJ-40]|uniref:HNH endonuclease n=1 Tax=Tissierella simiarum TaxID=2841534 RepID=A0ABS6EAZ2_9FIRM|nr:HNH endonuclease [Tissierella simiarum]